MVAPIRSRAWIKASIYFTIIATLVVTGVTWLTNPFWEWRVLPDIVVADRVLASSRFSGLGEGCRAVVYKLSDETAARLVKEGIDLLERATPRINDLSNRYTAWMETPGFLDAAAKRVPGAEVVYGLNAMGGCEGLDGPNQPVRDYRERDITKAISERGSYFTVTNNREGIILVAPKAHLAAFFYWG